MQVLIYLFPHWGFLILVWILSYQCQEEKERYILMFFIFPKFLVILLYLLVGIINIMSVLVLNLKCRIKNIFILGNVYINIYVYTYTCTYMFYEIIPLPCY